MVVQLKVRAGVGDGLDDGEGDPLRVGESVREPEAAHDRDAV